MLKTQRIDGFKGGIQAGTTAFDTDSKKLDIQAKDARDLLAEQFDDITMVKQFNKEMKMVLVGDDCFGFAPDGGAWFKNGKLVACFECKKQGLGGNAYERWWDNAMTAKFINEDVVYVTFCSGPGAASGEGLDKLRRKAQIMMGNNFVFHMSVDGFTDDFVLEEMKKVLENA